MVVLKSVKYLSLGVLLLAFLAFLLLPFTGTWVLRAGVFDEVVSNDKHHEALAPGFAPHFDEEFTNVFAFNRAVDAVIDRWNNDAKEAGRWEDVIHDAYAFRLAKGARLKDDLLGEGWLLMVLTFLLCAAVFGWLHATHAEAQQGVHSGSFHKGLSNRGFVGVLLGTLLIVFYIALYWFPAYIVNWVILLDPLSLALQGKLADQWFMYGFLYTLAIVVMGWRYVLKYKHSAYHKIRTASLVFFQVCFAFIIPQVLSGLNMPAYDLKNMWPLDYAFFFDYRINEMLAAGRFGIFMLVWGVVLFVVGVPVMTYFFGKRWYCSWVCGCGGLAETAGDPFRQLSDKRIVAWRVERWMVHGVLVLAVLMTAAVLYTFFTNESLLLNGFGLYITSYDVRAWYGFAIGAVFSGVVGTGFYPLMGNRVWCRFGCPLAAYMGLVQRFKSRFRITTNGGQCISCGNCSTYCEMGIDVRAYAQKGQNIVRASCVGCGVCASVCPRGVLKLENGKDSGASRWENGPIVFGNDGVKLKF